MNRGSRWLALVAALSLASIGPAGADTAPSFDQASTYDVGVEPRSVAIADVNSDGFPDAIVAVSGTSLGGDPVDKFKLVVVKGDGQGVFTSPGPQDRIPTHETDGHMEMAIDTGDLNRDGLTDVVMATTKGVDVFYQAPKAPGQAQGPGLLPPVLLGPGKAAHRVVVADVDGRGGDDIVALLDTGVFHYKAFGGEGATVQVPGGWVVPPEEFGQSGSEIAVGDVVGEDGHQDVLLLTGDKILVYQAHEEFIDNVPSAVKRTYFEQTPWHLTPVLREPGDSMADIEVGEVTGDGRDDVVVTISGNGPNGRINVFPRVEASGEEEPSLGPGIPYAAPGDVPSAVQVADLDADGKREVVVAHPGAAGIFLLREDGTLAPECLVPLPNVPYNVTAFAVGDVSGDQRQDIAGVAQGMGFAIRRQLPPGEGSSSLTLAPNNPISSPNQLVSLAGVLDLDGACPTAGQLVKVFRVSPDGTRSQIGVAETDAAGRYSFEVASGLPGTYRYLATWAGDEQRPPAESSVAELVVRKVVTSVQAQLSGHQKVKDGVRVYRGKKATFTALVSPAQAGDSVVVTVDIRQDGRWKRIKTLGLPTDSSGEVVTKLGGRDGRTYRVQATLMEDQDGLPAASPVLRFRFARR